MVINLQAFDKYYSQECKKRGYLYIVKMMI